MNFDIISFHKSLKATSGASMNNIKKSAVFLENENENLLFWKTAENIF